MLHYSQKSLASNIYSAEILRTIGRCSSDYFPRAWQWFLFSTGLFRRHRHCSHKCRITMRKYPEHTFLASTFSLLLQIPVMSCSFLLADSTEIIPAEHGEPNRKDSFKFGAEDVGDVMCVDFPILAKMGMPNKEYLGMNSVLPEVRTIRRIFVMWQGNAAYCHIFKCYFGKNTFLGMRTNSSSNVSLSIHCSF